MPKNNRPLPWRAAVVSGLALPLLALGACAKKADPSMPVAVVSTGLSTPESVLWDATHRVWYVSNINGVPIVKDDNGYIVRLNAEGVPMDSTPFIDGANAAYTLNAPKGMALVGDTLWVTDIDAVRAFNVLTGAHIASLELAGQKATFLNDATAGPDGRVYITDTGISFGADGTTLHPGDSRVFVVEGRTARTAVTLPAQTAPNGITWDAARGAFLMVAFNSPNIFLWAPGTDSVVVIGTGPGGADGLEVLADGRAIYTSWVDSSLTAFVNGKSETLRKNLPAPADIGLDPARRWVAVPLFNDHRVEFWTVPPAATP